MRRELFAIGSNDSPEFVKMVETIVAGRLEGNLSRQVEAIKIDNWFDHKWLNFLGTMTPYRIAVWTSELTTPPFAPKRIVQGRLYEFTGLEYKWAGNLRLPTHIKSGGVRSGRGPVPMEGDSKLFVWMSSNTKSNDRGSMMVYDIVGKQQDSWYCSFVKGESWKLERCKGTSRTVVDFYLSRGDLKLLGFHFPRCGIRPNQAR